MANSTAHWKLLAKAAHRIHSRDLNGYFELKSLLHGDANHRDTFKAKFTTYYGLNSGGLTNKLKERYFELLFSHEAQNQKDPYTDLLTELYKYPNQRGYQTLQGSFVSKLVAIHDEERPIYDTHVGNFFGVSSPSIGPIDFRIAGFVANLEHIRQIYSIWKSEREYTQLTGKLFQKHPALQSCHAVRVCDFLVWAVGHYRIK